METQVAKESKGRGLARLVTWRRVVALGALMVLGGAFAGISAQQIADSAKTVNAQVVPAVAPFAGGTSVTVMGSGLEPGTNLSIVIKDGNGLLSDITGLMSPSAITVDDDGAFAASWTLGRWTRVASEDLLSLRIVDSELNVLITAPVLFCSPPDAEGASTSEIAACP